MRVAIDASTICSPSGGEGAGIEHYTWSLVFFLVREFPAHHFLIFVPAAFSKMRERELAGCCRNIRVIRARNWRVPFVFRHMLFPLAAFLWHAEVMLLPAAHGPLFWQGKSVAVVHDVAIYEHPEWFPEASVENLTTRWIVPRILARATRLIAVSEATKQAIERMFSFLCTPISVVGEGVSDPFSQDAVSGVEEFVLFLGTLEPRKNIETACRVFDYFLELHPEKVGGLRFLIAGAEGWKTEGIHEAVADVNQRWQEASGEDVIRIVGPVSEREKWFLYHNAQAFLFPSLEEGAGALPEVAGEAALMADPQDVEALTALLSQCLLMPEVAEGLRIAGRERAKQFSWEAVAKQVGEILEAAASPVIARNEPFDFAQGKLRE